MQLSVSDNVNFKSRNETIRFADSIMRKVKENYPVISATRVDCFQYVHSSYNLEVRLHGRCNIMRKETVLNFDAAKTLDEKILSLVLPIKKYHSANCGEFGLLSAIASKVNGLKNSYPVIVKTFEGKTLDHAALYVKDKKPYIIDSWLGFADYVPNTATRYRTEFLRFFDGLWINDKVVFVKQNNQYCNYINEITSDEQINTLKILFPELIINKPAKISQKNI